MNFSKLEGEVMSQEFEEFDEDSSIKMVKFNENQQSTHPVIIINSSAEESSFKFTDDYLAEVPLNQHVIMLLRHPVTKKLKFYQYSLRSILCAPLSGGVEVPDA